MIPGRLAVAGTTRTATVCPVQLGKHRGGEDTGFTSLPDGHGHCCALKDEPLRGVVLGHAEGRQYREQAARGRGLFDAATAPLLLTEDGDPVRKRAQLTQPACPPGTLQVRT